MTNFDFDPTEDVMAQLAELTKASGISVADITRIELPDVPEPVADELDDDFDSLAAFQEPRAPITMGPVSYYINKNYKKRDEDPDYLLNIPQPIEHTYKKYGKDIFPETSVEKKHISLMNRLGAAAILSSGLLLNPEESPVLPDHLEIIKTNELELISDEKKSNFRVGDLKRNSLPENLF